MTVPAAAVLVVLLAIGVYPYWRSRRHPSAAVQPPPRVPRSRQSIPDRLRMAWTRLQTERRARLQLGATLAGGFTAAFLALFLFGEVASGDLSGLAHLVQVGPLVALLLLGWWRPRLAGALLLAGGGSLVAAYLVETNDSTVARSEQLLVAALFLFPPILAGALFLVAARTVHSSRVDRAA